MEGRHKMARIEIGKDKGDTTSPNGGKQAWGTLEELLLACAVDRHGTGSWDSIAQEVQKRSFKSRNNQSNDNGLLNVFTPHNCEQKYRDLRRRFNVNRASVGDTIVDGDGGGGKGNDEEDGRDELSCIVDELRKLRVEELKREVHRHDVSIVSLKMKVKRLEDERERSLKGEAEAAADLTKGTGGKNMEPERSPLEKADGEAASCRGPDVPDDRSFNESNSTNHNGDNRRAAGAGKLRESKGEPDENRSVDWEPVQAAIKSEPAKDCSFSGGSGKLGDGDNGRMVELELSQPSRLGDAVELRESLSDAKREIKETAKQSSDMQSSASLSRRKRRCWRSGGVGGSSGDEVGAEEQSPANKRISVKSQPLIRFMEVLRSHKHGSVFERRLPSQKTAKYQNLVRRHMDLETVQSKLDKGTYRGSHLKFYLDLLLIFTNAVLFYPKNSAEHVAAWELRKLVNEEIAQTIQKPTPDPQPQLLEPVVKRPRSATSMIVCRRRSSSSVKLPTPESMNGKKNGEGGMENARDREEKLEPNLEKPLNNNNNNNNNNNSNNNGHAKRSDQKGVQKKLTRERTALGNRSWETSKNNDRKKKKNTETRRDIDDKEDTSAGHEEDKELEIIKKQTQEKAVMATKKQGVVNFLKRIKQNSPAREGGVTEDERREKAKTDDKKGGKRRENKRVDEVLKRRRSERREGKVVEREIDKRGVGRPPRRKAATGVAESAVGKRKRESGEKEAGGSGRRGKKSRR